MTGASSGTTELVDYGRTIGLFAKVSIAGPRIELLTEDPRISDISELLRRESSPAGLSGWSKTPFAGSGSVIEITSIGEMFRTPAGTGLVNSGFEVPLFDLPAFEVQAVQEPLTSTFLLAHTTQISTARAAALSGFDFEAAVGEIRAVTGLSIAEFTRLVGRTRERYYSWRRGPVPEAIVAKIRGINAAVAGVKSEAPHLVREWLRADQDAVFNLLAAEDYGAFARAARAWVASRRPREARAIGLTEIATWSAADEPDDAIERFRALSKKSETAPAPSVAPNPNFYRDLLGSDSDTDE